MQRFDGKGRLRVPDLEQLVNRTEGIAFSNDKVLVQQLYCPNGHSLINGDNERFDDEPGIRLVCESADVRHIVHLSPFHKDTRKKTAASWAPGEVLILRCPECDIELPPLAPHDCSPGAMYVTMFLSKDADMHNSVSICDAWGCYASFLRLYSEVITDLRRHSLAP